MLSNRKQSGKETPVNNLQVTTSFYSPRVKTTL